MWNVILLLFKALWLFLAIWHLEINITAALRKDVEVSDDNLVFGAAAITIFIFLQWLI
jgi:hypothetical protein